MQWDSPGPTCWRSPGHLLPEPCLRGHSGFPAGDKRESRERVPGLTVSAENFCAATGGSNTASSGSQHSCGGSMVTLEGTKRGRHPMLCALALGEDPVCKCANERARTAPRSYGRWWRPHRPSVRSGRCSSNSFGCPCCCQIALVSRILPSRPLRPPACISPPSAPPPSATAPAQGPPGAQGCEGDNEGYQDQASVCWCCLHASFKQMQGHTLQACTLTQVP